VHGLGHDKKSCTDFVNILSSHDICFLYESWTNPKSSVSLNGFVTHHFYRKFQNRNARRSSGGLILYFKEHLKEGIEIIQNHHDTIIWLKLDKHFFKTDEDIFICGTYLWGENSPAYNIVNIDLFDSLENDISTYSSVGAVYIIGDFNSRVGSKSDFIVHDKINTVIDDLDYEPDCTPVRASIDKIHNSHGIKLLDLCKSSNIRILNGRIGDSNKYTYLSNNGTSVIDYVLCSEHNFSFISDFSIGSFNEWSDHAPLHLSLLCNNAHMSNDYLETKYKWKDSSINQFRSSIIARLPEFNYIVNNLNCNNRELVNNALNDFTKVLRSVTDPLFSKRCHVKSDYSFDDVFPVKHADWFDQECVNARNVYTEATRLFNSCKSDSNRIQLCESKKQYKHLIRKKKNAFKKQKMLELEKLKKNKPKDFWKYFKKKAHNFNSGISLEEFKNYFSNLSNDFFECENEDAEIFCENYDFNSKNESFPELDVPITINEVISAVKSLKRNKAYGSDCVLNEYLIESIDILAAHLCDLFNCILNSGCFPDMWSEGIIIPLYKKGNIKDVNNYRGITLVSCLAKLFTTIVNKRVEQFCNEHNIISDAQFGFRKGRSTVDAIFVLMSLVKKYLNENKRLYVIFVDMMKCFDSIYRNGMWLKLYNCGIQGKLLRIVRDMYTKVKSCVKLCSNFSDYFEYAVGLRQGEVMSPLLFSIFVEDLELFLQKDIDSGIALDDILLILLLFADDMAIIGKTPVEIQQHLDNLYTYCDTWGLKVNTSKTKIMVFRKRGGLLNSEHWNYNGQNIEVVNDFNYLGTVFNYTGTFNLNQEHLVGKALKAMNILLCKCKEFDLSPKVLCQLFDAFVGSILNYASEIWGYSKSKEIERIHLKFCKRLLNVKTNTCNASVYSELGRYPLYIQRYTRMIKYWLKIINTDNIILKTIYNQAVVDCYNGQVNWVSNIRKLLTDYGFAYVFDNVNNINVELFLSELKYRIVDTFKQETLSTIDNSSMLCLYKHVKTSHSYEQYLDILPRRYRFYFCRLRLSSLPLRIQTGRYSRNRIPREERSCLICNSSDIEDEYHFVCICHCYNNIRRKYLKKYYYVKPSVYKFVQLLNSNNKADLINLSKFVKEGLCIRNALTTENN
jgi:hypothetical protein